MARHLNADATVGDIIRAFKETASRPAGSAWGPELGWGILDAGAALNAVRAIDRRAPQSKLTGRTRGPLDPAALDRRPTTRRRG